MFEFWVPQSNERADLAVVGATLEGFEIKTHRDSLKRLRRQADAYSRVFDRCHAVLAPRHLEPALEILPPWWGVIVIDEGVAFTTLRRAQSNCSVDAGTLVRLLWRNEAHSALCALGYPPDRRAGRFSMWELLMEKLDIDGLKEVVRNTLRLRAFSRVRIRSQRLGLS
jgi:hypothetical protein